MSTLRIHLLGDFLFALDEAPVTTLAVPRLQSLLAYLLLHRDAPQDRSHLAFLLWPDSTEAQAHTNLRKLLYHLRQAFPEAEQFIRIDNRSLQWLPARAEACWTLDVQELEQAVARAAQAEHIRDTGAARLELEQAVNLYRGDLLSGSYDEWLLPERDRLLQLFLQAAQRLLALQEQERDYEAATATAQRLLRQDTPREATYRQLMRLHALRGDRAAALRVYHTCATILERELGAEPSEATQAAYEALLLTRNAPASTNGPLAERGTAAPLLGRRAEWQKIQGAWRRASNGQPHIVLLTGEAGIGKTRLAEELEAWVSRQGMATASARCYTALGQLAYAPVTTWLRSEALQTALATLDPTWLTEIARLVPEVLTRRPKLARPSALTEGWQRQQFFEALARAVLATHQPLLLLLDDLQWCDHETLEWLHFLIRYAAGARLLLLGTARAEEMPAGHPLVALLATLQRDGLVTEITLGPLATAETTTLAEQITGSSLNSAASSALYAETEGNPLFVVEMARACHLSQSKDSGPLPLLTQPASSLPPAVQTVLAARLAQLSPLAQDIANVASVIGRAFSFSVLALASGEPEESVVHGLDELWQRRIVREQRADTAETYDFSHDKLREYVYASLSPAHRRLLHRHVAEALKRLYAEDLDAVSGQIATHYEYASLPAQAIPFYQQAAEAARRIYANMEALHTLERAAALLAIPLRQPFLARTEHMNGPRVLATDQMSKEIRWKITAEIAEAFGDVSLEIGSYEQARRAYHCALTVLPPQEQLWHARMQQKVARAWNYTSNNPQDAPHANAREAFQEAERILASIADSANPAWRREWIGLQAAQIWPLRGSADDMTAAIEKARPVIEQYGTREERKLLRDAIGMRDGVRSHFAVSEQAIANRRQALEEALRAENKSEIGIAQMALGIILLWADQLDEAEELLTQARRLGEQVGIAWLQTRCLTFLPFIFRKRGEVEQVRALLAQAQTIGVDQNNSMLAGLRAWLALREGDLLQAEAAGKEAAELEQQSVGTNPFRWSGLWPLLGVALVRGQIDVAIGHARLLLDTTQQQPSAPIKTLLETALQAWDANQQAKASDIFRQIVPLAEKAGYL